MKTIKKGIYPTMITPYKNGKIDYASVEKLTQWYIREGCQGVFAVCQSSEMHFLSLKERVRLAKAVVDASEGKLDVVASGHCADSLEEQAEESNQISQTGIDAFVLVSNRLDLHNDGDKTFIENGEKLLENIDKDIPLGIYECPKPYKRLLTDEILEWMLSTKRFRFIKDTCCCPDLLKKRLEFLNGSDCALFNANEQTLVHSLKYGASGYSGIMANFHPRLLVWLFENFENEQSETISDILSMSAFTESPAYPCTAKYYLNLEGIPMDIYSRSADHKNLTEYQKMIVKQMYHLNNTLKKHLGL